MTECKEEPASSKGSMDEKRMEEPFDDGGSVSSKGRLHEKSMEARDDNLMSFDVFLPPSLHDSSRAGLAKGSSGCSVARSEGLHRKVSIIPLPLTSMGSRGWNMLCINKGRYS